MKLNDHLSCGLAIAAFWGVYFFYPTPIPLIAPILFTIGLTAYDLSYTRSRQSSPLPPEYNPLTGADHFPVDRKAGMVSGALYLCCGVVLLSSVLWSAFFLGNPPFKSLSLPIGAIAMFIGVTFLLAQRNVREILIGEQQITFLPRGDTIDLKDITLLSLPPQGEEISLVQLTLRSSRYRFIPGVLSQWRHTCWISISGSDKSALTETLRNRLLEAHGRVPASKPVNRILRTLSAPTMDTASAPTTER